MSTVTFRVQRKEITDADGKVVRDVDGKVVKVDSDGRAVRDEDGKVVRVEGKATRGPDGRPDRRVKEEDVEYITILAGDPNNVVDRPVTDADRELYARQYALFRKDGPKKPLDSGEKEMLAELEAQAKADETSGESHKKKKQW